ncbi:MAG: hypothetical protein JW982_06625 [Spirochaetes bacterium]|nr:hypothetical protein [Spirochaetota bacterium]
MKKLFLPLFIFMAVLLSANGNENSFYVSVSKTITYYNTSECFELLGYKVFFPDDLPGKCRLEHVSLGVGLGRQVTRENGNQLEKTMQESIENNEIFNQLSDYDPFRQIGAVYSYGTGSVKLVVATMPSSSYGIVENDKSGMASFLKNGKRYYWIDYSDNEQQENQSPMLIWENDEISFMVFLLNGKSLNEKQAVRIAEEVMKFN